MEINDEPGFSFHLFVFGFPSCLDGIRISPDYLSKSFHHKFSDETMKPPHPSANWGPLMKADCWCHLNLTSNLMACQQCNPDQTIKAFLCRARRVRRAEVIVRFILHGETKTAFWPNFPTPTSFGMQRRMQMCRLKLHFIGCWGWVAA